MRHVLVVSGGGAMTPLLRQLPGGVRASVICRNRLVPKVAEPQRAPYLISVPDTAPAETWACLAQAIHKVDPIDHVVSFSETDQDKAPAIAGRLGLNAVHSSETIGNVYDKFRMRQVLAGAGIDQTRSDLVSDLDDVRSFAAEHGYPVILKPRTGTASLGVSLIRSPDELEAAFAWAFASDEPWNGELIVEQFLDGPEFSVECFSEDGAHVVMAVTQKSTGSVHFVESGHVLPAPIPGELRRRLGDYVLAALTALGVRSGPTHSEVILTEGGPAMVETHVRLGGDEIPELICDVFGLNARMLWARQASGEHVLPEIRKALRADPAACAGVRFLMPPRAGRLAAVSGLAEARDLDGVVAVRQLKRAGEPLCAEARGSFDRCALVRAVGKDAPSVIEVLDQACARLAISVEQDGHADERG